MLHTGVVEGPQEGVCDGVVSVQQQQSEHSTNSNVI